MTIQNYYLLNPFSITRYAGTELFEKVKDGVDYVADKAKQGIDDAAELAGLTNKPINPPAPELETKVQVLTHASCSWISIEYV